MTAGPHWAPRGPLFLICMLAVGCHAGAYGEPENPSSSSGGFGTVRTVKPQPETLATELKRDPSKLIAEVEKVRKLKAKAPIPILLDNEEAFAAAFETSTRKLTPQQLEEFSAYFATFNLAPEKAEPTSSEAPPSKQSKLGVLYDEQLLAFYDTNTRKVHVRVAKVSSSKKPLAEQRGVVAHEIEHALQHQWFGDIDRSLEDADAQLAFRSVIEGDAMVVMAGQMAERRSLRRVLTRLSQAVRDGMLSDHRDSPTLRKAPAMIRERFTFPYENGLDFMGELYRSGGLNLMNRAFTALPESSEHILHPEKYLAGEHVIPIESPVAPSGYTKVASGKLGELSIRAFLGQCLAGDVASNAASGWGGDAYTVVKDAKGKLSLMWSTAWDDEASAARFASAIDSVSPCWARRSRTEHHDRPVVVTQKTKVAVLHGFPESERNSIGKNLLALVGDRLDPTPPSPGATIIPAPPRPTLEPAVINADGYSFPSLGLRAPVPQGYRGKIDENGFASLKGSLADSPDLMISVIDELSDDAGLDRMFDEFTSGLRSVFKERRLKKAAFGDMTLPLGTARVQLLTVSDSPVQIRVHLLPVCNRNASIFIVTTWASDRGKHLAESWLRSVTIGSYPKGRAPFCDEVDP